MVIGVIPLMVQFTWFHSHGYFPISYFACVLPTKNYVEQSSLHKAQYRSDCICRQSMWRCECYLL